MLNWIIKGNFGEENFMEPAFPNHKRSGKSKVAFFWKALVFANFNLQYSGCFKKTFGPPFC